MTDLSITYPRFFLELPPEMATKICSYFPLAPAIANLQTGKEVPLESSITVSQRKNLQEAHKITELWFAWMRISGISKEHRVVAHSHMIELGKKITRLVQGLEGCFQRLKRCMKRCIDRGWFLDVWKVYYYYNWHRLAKTYPEHRKILHWAIAPKFHTQSKAFVSFLLDINKEHGLGLLREKDKYRYLPVHAICHIMHPSKAQQTVLAQLIEIIVKKDPDGTDPIRTLTTPRIYPYKVDVTPLFLAAFSENLEVIPVLLENGADLEQKNSESATALQLLQEFAPKDSPAWAYLISLGAKLPVPAPQSCVSPPSEKEQRRLTLFQWLWTLIAVA